jgi:ligand-binding sensor domain-containing protein/signal transduction histidine kinase
MNRFLTILSFNLILFHFGYSHPYGFTNYSINEGLSQSVVNCVFQDSKGYIWIGTQNGLNRFNGETFDVYSYNPADSNSISNNWIYTISEDIGGSLWIGTKGGLNKYLPAKNHFKRIYYKTGFNFDVTQYFYDVICLKNGNILINTPPVVSIYNPEEESFNHFQSKFEYDGAVKDVKIPVIEDKDGIIWAGATNGLASFSFQNNDFSYYLFVDKNGKPVDGINITALFNDKKGKLWVGTTVGLFSLNKTTNRFEEFQFNTFSSPKFSFEKICIRTIIEDKKGNLIIGTEGNGLFVLEGSQNQFEIQNYTSENSEISHNIVQSLIIDKSDNLWIGTLSGISKTDLKKKKFNLYRNSNSPNSLDLLGNVIASLYKDDNGILWVGNWGQGLNLVNRKTNEVEHFSTQQTGNHKISNDFVHVIFKDIDSNIWLGTRNGLLIYDKPRNRFLPYYEFFKNPALPTFGNMRIYMIIQDKSLNYWIGTQNGLYKIHLKKSIVEVFQKELPEEKLQISANLVYCILEDSEGLIWIATLGGLDAYNPITGKIKHFNKEKNGLSDDFVITLCEDAKGRIWIGTSTYVNVFDKKDSTFTFYSQVEGLPNNRIFEIRKDMNNDIWVATGKGLCKFDEQKSTFQTFTPEDGLQSLEFNLRAACVCSDGEMLFGGMNGFNSFYPDSISGNPYVPNLVFTSFYTQKGAAKEYVNLEETPQIILNHNVYSFTIEFAALEYTNPKKNKYAYKMEGISSEWVEIGNRKFVPFFALQPGEYTFKVKGSNNDGVWNDNAININIVVLPPWWRSIYAYFAYMVFILVSIIVFIKTRERKLKHDKKLLEEKVLERTLQIEEQNKLIVSKNQELNELNRTKDKFFSIIGHDLGNQFNIILGFLEVLVSDFKKLDSGKVEQHLTNIYNSSKQAFNLLENLLTWARMQTNRIHYNPEKFILSKKMTESLELLSGASTKKNIQIEVFSEEEIAVYADINMFSTVFRNLVANAIKFTHENGKISIKIRKKDNFCEICVIDNGVGISHEDVQKIFRIDSKHKTVGTSGEKGTGLGLVLCKDFVEKNGGQISVKSTVGEGSEFCFTLPIKE